MVALNQKLSEGINGEVIAELMNLPNDVGSFACRHSTDGEAGSDAWQAMFSASVAGWKVGYLGFMLCSG